MKEWSNIRLFYRSRISRNRDHHGVCLVEPGVMTSLTRQSENGPIKRPGGFTRRSWHANRDSSRSRIFTNGDNHCDQCDEWSQTAMSVCKMEVRKYKSILDITGILARKTRRPTGHFRIQWRGPFHQTTTTTRPILSIKF